ncbi:MAG TPA: endonuclease/exonuclease/phosphatase family protein, partial [Saprospiraceae bacterium]|nr:endonuclease/exonuclease/phosphatase family protein [Saprospiraceae bacterium]
MSIVTNSQGQQAKITCIGFYNLENLFDTEDDPTIADEEFTPTGPKAWTEDKYQDKLIRLSEVIVKLGTDLNPDGVGILGVCEVENRRVLQDLVNTPNLKERNYQILHFNSFDPRGIDLAILYQEKYFTPLEAQMIEIPLTDADGKSRKTRGLLVAKGKIENQTAYILVNH